MIRTATIDDIRQLYLWTEAYHREYVIRKQYPVGFDWIRAGNQLYNWLHSETSVNLLTNHAMLFGEIREAWFSTDNFAVLNVLYCEPSYRNGLLARSLLNRFQEIAQEKKCVALLWDDWAGMTDTEMLTEYLEKLGFEVQGHVYRKDLYAVDYTVHTSYCVSGGGPNIEPCGEQGSTEQR